MLFSISSPISSTHCIGGALKQFPAAASRLYVRLQLFDNQTCVETIHVEHAHKDVVVYSPIWGTSYWRLPRGDRNINCDENDASANGAIEFWSRFCQVVSICIGDSGRGRRKESRSRCSGCGVASAHTQTAAASTAHIAACTLTPSGDHCAQPSVTRTTVFLK